MRIAGETVGARGVTLLSVAAIAGLILGIHGWSVRGHGAAPGLSPVAGKAVSASAASPSAGSPSANSPSANSPSAQPSQSGNSAAPTQGATPAATPIPGAKLSAQSYASYAYQVWPGAISQAGQAALTGLSVKVTKQGAGIQVAAGVNGQPAQAPVFYPGGVKVWIIESSLGDDSGNSDYSLGDDGLVVTDAQGRMLQ